MKRPLLSVVLLTLGCICCALRAWCTTVYNSPTLTIEPISSNTFVHISYLNSPTFGHVPCNGLVFIDQQEAIVYDTPIDNAAAAELIDWIENVKKCKIKAVIATHFHDDCIGGLEEFHKHKITSYASRATIASIKKKGGERPKRGFKNRLELKIGQQPTITQYYGPGHTLDNVVGYIPSENILFGGCLVKEMEAGKGNLEDADTEQWPFTIEKIKMQLPNLTVVVPGHGKWGDSELLDYTIALFSKQAK
ncbi:metallo-beta-lactamase class B [Dyadobacter jejuensis]|uniref:beta-lactamase n=1 Tax=Dyadobacter jejuensis TaxID=1082580 RepID=A0A316AEA1_9BACT|nr:subclass B1 metallo-beta-lactamase [Dyadobacter jejuensis]PWJ55951.1 metallo-beta-lactamase class B [Dyadobacter jejuensis]